jgi:filamentous hemagglutinin family protein
VPQTPKTLRQTLLHGASCSALMVATAAVPQARAGGFRSIGQALAAAPTSAAANAAAGLTAARQAALGAQNLATAAARFSSIQQALSAAATASSAAQVPNGLAPGGLVIGTGVSADGGKTIANPTLWNGAALPTQTTSTGGTNVTVVQNAALAQLSWQTFNVGAKTHLTFNQSAGGTQASSWIVINSVQDPLANPTQIEGDISATGKVYILNRNGIAFSAGSQINVGSLIAATASIASTQFTQNADRSTNFSLYGAKSGSGFAPSFVPYTDSNGNALASGNITVEAGAVIETPAPTGSSGGGYVMLLGANVANAGAIMTPQGQTVLAGGSSFTLRQGYAGSVTTGNFLATTLGSQVDSTNTGTVDPATGSTLFTTGTVANSGLIVADQGDITMAGHALTQAGVLLSTTTVNTRGTIHLLTDTDDTTASVTLAPQSVTEILPEDDGETALDAQRASNIANSATLNAERNTAASATNPQLADQSNLPDLQGEGRIEVSSGGSVDVQPGALALAQGGQVAIGAGKSVLVESGATIDVSGTDSALLPASVNDLLVSVQPYQTRDSAGNRDGALKSTTLNVDARTLLEIAGNGPYAGNIYTQGGLLEVSGYLGLVPHSITEWAAIGGQVTIQAQSTAGTGTVGGTVITQPGSVINVQGGVVNYAAGVVSQSYVVATDGTIYNVNEAPGNLVYTGVYTGETEVHARWHVTDTFINPLLTPSEIMNPAYSIGRDAGTLSVYAATTLLQGAVDAGVSLGTGQTGARPVGITDPYLLAQTVAPQAGTLAIGAYSNTASVTIYDTSATIGTGAIGTATPLANTAVLDAGAIAAAGFATVSINTGGDIAITAPLGVADGGTITLIGSTIEANASLTARGGAITLTNTNPLSSSSTATTAPSISVGSNATLDARGEWTNAVLDPVHVAGEAFAHGGTVTIQGTGAVDLAAGSAIAVSSGGALLGTGKLLGAGGGSVFLSADIQPGASSLASAGTAPVTLGATFAGTGTSGGGTLSLEAPAFALGFAQAPSGVIAIGSALFQSGFSSYVLNGFNAVTVAPGAQITVAEPVYVLGGTGGSSVPTGGDPGQVFAVILPAIYTPNRSTDAVTQRAGASISLVSSVDPKVPGAGGGSLTVGAGASISVDPGQSISLLAYGQVTVLGTLTAHGGSITAANSNFEISTDQTNSTLNYQPGTSIWIGAGAILDVSGQAIGFTDSLGQSFADRTALAGGSITLGADPATNNPTDSQVIVRPGAVLDANGASVTVDVVPLAGNLAPVTLAGAGGTISANSATGLALDGAITAAAGGGSAAGGALNLRIDNLPLANTIFPDYLDQPRDIIVSNATTLVQTDASLQPGDLAPADSFGVARLSQAQITAGGFDAVNLSAEDAVVFEGNVALSAGRSITINAGLVGDSVAGATVSLAAPHVSFLYTGAGTIATSAEISTGTLTVAAGLIDFADQVTIGGTSTLTPLFTTEMAQQTSVAGFAVADFVSTGDIRFLGGAGSLGVLQTSGNLAFTAAELLPASGATETIYAGLNDSVSGTSTASALAGGTISVFGNGGAQQAASVGGTLALVADSIVQDGVIRAPEGDIRLGFDNFADTTYTHDDAATYTSSVVLDAGSVTSVSLIGQTIPFGGTVDGVNYLVGSSAAPLFSPMVEVEAEQFTASAGATLDLRGGGTLAGAGFIAGRGGSADVLKTPLLDITGGAAVANAKAQVAAITPVNSGDAVYAILPSYQGNYAPAAYAPQDSGYTPTVAGEQITVGSQIPGLKPGTYTLLPAYYALLPGGFRVELTSGTVPAGSLATLGNFTDQAPITIGVAGTSIASQVPVAALFTSSANVGQLAQYDTESYNTFESTAGATFGTPRPFLPQDAKTLFLNYPSQVSIGTALAIDPSVLLKTPDTADGGYGMTLEIATPNAIEIIPAGATATATNSGTPTLALDAGVLSKLDVPRLLLGGTFTLSGNMLDLLGEASAVTVDPGASLAAGEVLLTVASSSGGAGSITISSQATVSTVGAGATAFDLADGYYMNNSQLGVSGAAFPVLDVSSGDIVFAPTASTAPGGLITVADNAALLATGSLDFVAPSGTNVGIGAATLGGKYVNLQVSTLNLGSATAFADYNRLYPGELPIGLNLTTTQLASLLNGNASLGTPAAQSLVITATLATNIIGNATPLTQWAPKTAYAAGQTVLYNGSVFICVSAGVSGSGGPATGTAGFQFQNASDTTGADLNAFVLTSGATALVLNTPAIYGFGTAGDSATIQAPSFTWSGVEYQNQAAGLGTAALVPVSSPPAAQIAGSASNLAPTLTIDAQKIVLGDGPQTQPDDQTQLDRLIIGFANVTLQASNEITANTQSSLSVYATQATYGQPGAAGNLTLATPLVTTDAAAVLKITAGGTLSLVTPQGVAPAATGSVTTLGGEIDLTATEIDMNTSVALPAGRLTATAQDDIAIGSLTSIDLAGRSTVLFDQIAQSPGGTLLLESTAGNITEASGAAIDVSSPGAMAGSVRITALSGQVALDGTLNGAAAAGQTAGSFTLIAGTLSAAGTGSDFDNLNTILDAGGFTGARSFELASGDIDIDQGIKASTLSVTADTGTITLSAKLDASGAAPGSIAINAGGNLTLESGAVLDAHATRTARDSYGEDIDAENRAHVTLTATHGSLLLDGGASIDLLYPDAAADPQGQLVLNAPRLATAAGVAATTTGPINVTGAESVAVYAFRTYTTHDSIGSISQTAQASPTGTGTTLSLEQIANTDTAWANGLTAAAVEAQLGGLTALTETTGGVTASAFHLRPGVEIDSTNQAHGTLTIIGDLDFCTLRISDPIGLGLQVTPKDTGSGEPGTVVFRATGDLVVNGSITDGFAAPPDSKTGKQIAPDRGWQILAPGGTGFADPLNADLVLPASLSVTTEVNGQTTTTDAVVLGAGTSFDTTRAIALNYTIDISAANLNPNVTIPFNFRLSSDTIVTTGFTATASITLPGQKTPAYVAGDQVPVNTDLPAGTLFAKNTLLPFSVQTGPNGTNVPAGTLLDVFADSTVTLYSNSAPLTVGAFIPSNTTPIFLTTTGQAIQRLVLRPDLAGTTAQGYIYAIAAMLPPGAQSWNLSLVAGANKNSADRLALLPKSQLDGGALRPAPALASQAPGSLILDDQHEATLASSSFSNVAAAFSVIRTGTGDLNLAVGGNFDQLSLYGIYTAGTQDLLPNASGATPSPTDAANAPFDLARQPAPGLTTILVSDFAANNLITSTYQAYYPTDGGDLSMHVQGNATGDLLGADANSTSVIPSDSVGNWLWTQGGAAAGEQTAWWINFGTFVTPYLPGGISTLATPQLVGFQGIGTLGGGNLTVTIGGNAGQTTHRTGAGSINADRGEGLVFAVAGTGRFPTGASPVISGGGTLSLRISGTLNPLDAFDTELPIETAVNGDVIDLRGNISMSAGAIGRIENSFVQQANDPRAADPFTVTDGVPYDGITLIPGDGSVTIATMRDLVVDGAADPGRVGEQNLTVVPTSLLGTDSSLGVDTGFTLWTATTAISLFSSGGNVAPSTHSSDTASTSFVNDAATDYRYIYPPTLLVTAATGSIVYGNQPAESAATSVGDSVTGNTPAIETMPAADGQVSFLAGTSIFANGEAVDISGANPALLATPTNPTFVAQATDAVSGQPVVLLQNGLTSDVFVPNAGASLPQALFAQEADTPTTNLHANDQAPARFYAAGGDIVNLITGETISFIPDSPEPLSQWYLAAKPVWILASQDIVSTGTRPQTTPGTTQQNQSPLVLNGTPLATASGNLFYNTAPSSISVVSAGRDILSAYLYVGGSSAAGAGVLEVDAGRNLYQAAATIGGGQALDFGAIKSIGALIPGSPLEPGADIAALAGVGADPNYSAFADLYLNPANLANPALQVTDPGNKDRVQQVYGGTDTVAGQSQLLTVLEQRFGFSGTPAQALAYYKALSPTAQTALLSPAGNGTAVLSQLYAYLITSIGYDGTEAAALATFKTLPATDQDVLLRKIFFEETNASGLQYNDPTSRFYQSYSRGRVAIDTFFLPLQELNTWLSKTYGYNGGQGDAAASFAALTPAQQQPFLSAIFTDDETQRTGDATVSAAFTSLLGQTDDKPPGVPTGYTGSMTMYSGPVTIAGASAPLLTSSGGTATFDAGISTSSYGGAIQAFDPGGQIVLGVASSPAPGAGSGIITNGPGDIDIFADGSVLLGKSRIFTTDGGSILIWSAGGDINAGIGAKTTIVFNPPIVSYDDGGDITETPAVPSSGAGIATLQPLPGITAGNVDLIAPTGTIDAGEAGIRVSGNLNLAAARLANTANIAVGGKTTGAPSVSVASLGAISAASSAAGAATSSAQSSAAGRAQQEQPSVIEVAVLSITGGNADDEKRRKRVK